jgi:chemotaxis protein histidine kinase CheA
MEIKVRAVGATDEKSQAEIEQELLTKHEEQFNNEAEVKVEVVEQNNEVPAAPSQEEAVQPEAEAQETPPELTEDEVLSYIKNRYDKKIDSVEQLFEAREESEPLPEDVSAYLNYKKETGRGINDFMKIQRDIDEIPADQILRDYLVATERGLDAEDIDTLMEGYSYDEDIDDESTVKKTRLAKKKAIAKARDYFESEKEKYQLPLESSGASISKEDQEKLDAYSKYVNESASYEERLKRQQEVFKQESEKIFNKEFKGFEFAIGEDKKTFYVPGDATEMLNNPQNFVKKFTGDDGSIVDWTGYHRSLALAMNPDKFAKFFYEQGMSAQADDSMRKMKNIDMSTRNTPEVTKQGGLQVKSLTNDSGRGLKIRSHRKK